MSVRPSDYPVVNRKPIKAAEYDAIKARFRALGRSDAAARQIAAEFNRGVSTIIKLRGAM